MNDEILDAGFRNPGIDLKNDDSVKKVNVLIIEVNDHIKHIIKARWALIALAGFSVLGGILGLVKNPFKASTLEVALESGILIVIYSACAYFISRKPRLSVIVGLSVYILYMMLAFMVEPSTLIQGFIAKIIIIYFLAQGILASQRLKRDTQLLSNMGLEEDKIDKAQKLIPLKRIPRTRQIL